MLLLRHAGLLLLCCLALSPLTAAAWERGVVEKFATLPAGFGNPEGIAVDRRGDVYVATFAVTAAPGTPGQLFVFGSDGRLKRQLSVAGSSNLLLAVDFHPQTDDLLVIDFGNKQVLNVNPNNGRSRLFATIPGGSSAGPNALTFDKAGNVYISDSFQGIVWRTGRNGGTPVAWASHPLLTTAGTPPFGANGMGFNKAESTLFVANTGDDRIIQIPVSAGAAGTPSVFVNSVNGADGLFVDDDDNIWVTANQADEIVVIDKTGRAIAKLGDFGGLDASGAPIGFLFPASPALHRGFVYVTNLALDIRLFGLPQAVDSQWAADVRSHTIARIRAVIPSVPR